MAYQRERRWPVKRVRERKGGLSEREKVACEESQGEKRWPR